MSCENKFLSSVSENVECENKCDHENESCSSTCIQNEIAKLKSQVERIEEKLDAILQKMDNNIIKNCDKMGDHIDFVNNVYDTVTITNKVTKYDTVIVKNTIYDTILKLKFKLTTGIQANKMASIFLYPNPTSDVLHIEVGDAKALEGYRYRIVDALGKEVYNELVKNAITEIPLKSLGAAGMYQFEVLDQKNTRIQVNKIVLQ